MTGPTPSLAGMTAAADQAVALTTSHIENMVHGYRSGRAAGLDRTMNTALVKKAALQTYDPDDLGQLLAVAVAMLAEQEPRP